VERILEVYSQLFANAPIGIYVEQAAKFVYINPLFPSSTQYSASELLGRRPISFVVPKERAFVRREVIRMLKGENKAPFKFRVKFKTGEIGWILWAVASAQYKSELAKASIWT
jgi:PAS domain S-box-containing protein